MPLYYRYRNALALTALLLSVSHGQAALNSLNGWFAGLGIDYMMYDDDAKLIDHYNHFDDNLHTSGNSKSINALMGYEATFDNGLYLGAMAFYQPTSQATQGEAHSILRDGSTAVNGLKRVNTSGFDLRIGGSLSPTAVFYAALGGTMTTFTGTLLNDGSRDVILANNREVGISPGVGLNVNAWRSWDITLQFSHTAMRSFTATDGQANGNVIEITPNYNEALLAISHRLTI